MYKIRTLPIDFEPRAGRLHTIRPHRLRLFLGQCQYQMLGIQWAGVGAALGGGEGVRVWGRHVPSVAPGSSLYGSFASRNSMMDERPDFARRPSSTSTIKPISGPDTRENAYPRIDEGYASLSGTSFGSNKSVLNLSSSTYGIVTSYGTP
jgi:hypothetical protein